MDMEERKTLQAHVTAITTNLLEDFSSLRRLKRVIAWILRFVWNCRKKKEVGWCAVEEENTAFWVEVTCGDRVTKVNMLSRHELETAFTVCVRISQQQSFSEEVKMLKTTRRVSAKSKILSLHPYLNKNGILSVAGRIGHSRLQNSSRHPIILHGSSHLVKLLVRQLHHDMFHAGFTQVWTTLNRGFWIVRGRDAVRHILHACVVCFRYRATAAELLMGQLPMSRVTPSRPFLEVGVDYAGPFTLKNPIGRVPKTYKGYLCVFICMASKAVHLEAVSSLSTDGFLDALRRLVSRRGLSTDLYSDCGTNFVGADKELQLFWNSHKTQQQFMEGAAEKHIQWHFNPPAAPHHGGLWEAAVKSAKFHLRRVVGDKCLTYEAFSTMLCQIEAVLNSRPLTPMSDDVDDMDVLTPGHLLIGEPLVAIPEPSLENVPNNRLKQHERQQQRVQHFWRRWSQEYLHTLQQRSKWRVERDEIGVGDLVLLMEDGSPGSWERGRITCVHPGRDGHVRGHVNFLKQFS